MHYFNNFLKLNKKNVVEIPWTQLQLPMLARVIAYFTETETLAYESLRKIVKLRFHCFKRRLDLAAYKHFNATRIMKMELEGIYYLAYFSATLWLWETN